MKEKCFLQVLFVAALFLIFMTIPTFAQEEVVTPEQEEVAPADTVVQEEVAPAEQPVPEEVITEEAPEEAPEEVVEEKPKEEEVKEEISKFKPGWTAKVYINGGPIEPWGDPGTGMEFNMGMRIQGGAQLNIGNWIKLPLVLQPLTAEVMVGYGMWNPKTDAGHYKDAKTSVISVLALGRYDVTDLIMKAIGFEYPALGIFGVAGLQYNMQSWDFPNWSREFDPVSQFGMNLGVGVKYNLQSMVGKPVEVDLRFTQGIFLMGEVKDTDGVPYYDASYWPTWDKDNRDYHHTENGLLLGIAYPF